MDSENLTWRKHVYTVQNKISKNIGLLYQGKNYLYDNCLKQIYFPYIHAYLIIQTSLGLVLIKLNWYYGTKVMVLNFLAPWTLLKTTWFAVLAWHPFIWNNCLSKNEKEIDNFLMFKKRATEKIMELSTAAISFQ